MVIIVVGHDEVVVCSEGHGFLGTGGIGEAGGAAGSGQIPGATVSRKGFREAQEHSQTAAEQDLY